MKNLFIIMISLFTCVWQAQSQTSILVNSNSTIGKLEPFWASQIIHPTEFLLTEWGQDLVDMITETGAARQYIRIYNQPEKAIRIDEKGTITYDWSLFDNMAEVILKTGNKPKIVFFGMPYELAAYPESVKKRPYGGLVCISPPKDYTLWEELCADFTRHVVNKYGLQEVKQWTFRCWNEPDLSNFWHKSDIDAYLKLYDYFAKGVRKVTKQIPIGGPALSGTNTYRDPKHLIRFFDHVTKGTNHATGEKGSPIDFIALHTYGGSGAAGGPGRVRPEVDYIFEQHIKYADLRDEYPGLKGLPIHVEEWGEASGGTKGVKEEPLADIRNSQAQASFLVEMVGRHVNMQVENDRNIRSFTLCGSGYEKIAEHDFMGYRTLHTKSGFYKPLLNAYKMLSIMGKDIIPVQVSSDAGILSFATKEDKKIYILINNYQQEHPFNDGLTETISLQVNPHWKLSENIVINHWRIDEHHSNAYTAFKELGSPLLPNPIEVDEIKKKMYLETMKTNYKIEDNLQIDFTLPCNGISLIEVYEQ